MGVETEIAKVLIALGTTIFPVLFSGFVYGLNRKVGIILIVSGLTLIVALVLWVIVGVGTSELASSWSWSSTIGVAIGGALILPTFETGVNLGEELKRNW